MPEDTILHGDVYACLTSLEDNSIAVAITSPPYWAQRDYEFEGQIGSEKTSEEYIGKLVSVFSKLREKLRDDGIFFLNVGDKYFNKYGKSNLLLIPYRLAYHMQKDGWIVEDIIMWYKPNHMPSSVKDRFANTYEPVIVLSKNKHNIYKKENNVLSIPLQPSKWKHTAVFPEKLVDELLKKINLKKEDIVLDPFGGTGTTAYAVKKLRNNNLNPLEIYSIMIEMSEEFVKIIQERVDIQKIVPVNHIEYKWKSLTNDYPSYTEINEIINNIYGEVFIANTSKELIAAFNGITGDNFKKYHRKDALYFFGVKNWDLEALYYANRIYGYNYVLRNMIIISNNFKWYPIFVFANDSTIVPYKFYIDRIRVDPLMKNEFDWDKIKFIGMKVKSSFSKETKEGTIVEILKNYEDGFPKIVCVQWNGKASIEFVIHPGEDEFLMEGLKFLCPFCHTTLKEIFNPISKTKCPNCKKELLNGKDSIPTIIEPEQIEIELENLKSIYSPIGKIIEINSFENKKKTSSKFADVKRVNWGASPGARKIMEGDYFAKMRLYRMDQPTIAKILSIIRESKDFKIKDLLEVFPDNYLHTVGHWFRTDFGGSVPKNEDAEKLEEVIGNGEKIWEILKRTALKFQTVKSSIKGKNPGDFIFDLSDEELINYLRLLFMTPNDYINSLTNKDNINIKNHQSDLDSFMKNE
ncbi:MAG TPA: site-specific DNA-methyltransferase [Methanofastidiosum sp.]|nr:site-specific DNA-methyltransferase [Methanofastidiosum sp.]